MKALAPMKSDHAPGDDVILLVEDESLVSIVTEETLNEAGYTVHLAMRLEEGMNLAQELEFDAAVLDINLGGGTNSYPIAHVLRSRGVPFMFVSGYGTAGVDTEFSDVMVVQKPFDPRELLAAVAACMKKGHA
jgi:DNA-binding response OmpR family regulator